MALKREGAMALLGIIALAVIVAVLVLPKALSEITEDVAINLFVRLLGLYGYLFLSVVALTTPFLKEITQIFGKPFLKVHHFFSIFGIVFITLHPVFNAIQRLSLSVFVPRFDSWEIFWRLAGRPALIVLYIALFAGILRAKAPKYWRPFHALMYLVLLFGIVHANLIGGDFKNLEIIIIFNVLFLVSIAGFALKRYKNFRMRHK